MESPPWTLLDSVNSVTGYAFTNFAERRNH
jgi:hypothetical protein